MPTESLYAPRIRLHDVLRRETAVTVELPIYRNNVLVGPTQAHFRLIDPSGNDVITLTVASIIANVATFTIAASDLPSTLAFGEGYMQHWRLTLAGESYTFRKPTSIARSALYPVISDLDLEAEYSDLASIRPASLGSTYQQYIDEAWIQLIQRIRDLGNLEYLIMSPQSLRSCHKNLTFYLIFKDMDSSGLGEARYMDLAREHRKNFEYDFKRLTFTYDIDSQGTVDDPNGGRSALGVFYTSAPPRVFGSRGRW